MACILLFLAVHLLQSSSSLFSTMFWDSKANPYLQQHHFWIICRKSFSGMYNFRFFGALFDNSLSRFGLLFNLVSGILWMLECFAGVFWFFYVGKRVVGPLEPGGLFFVCWNRKSL
ncbi:uncharacterized protein A4U43_C08F25430 [Asparagus officinalis]|nr:uncharacterized protein A4U43_C08F25430 [Asparagus officinalis]